MDSQPRRPGLFCRLCSLCRRLPNADRMLAIWMLSCLATLVPVVLMQLVGLFSFLDDAQLRLLAGHPFYLGAEEAQVSLLSPVGLFCVCTLLTLWLAAVLLREHSLSHRSQVAFLAALAVALPGLLCVLWGGVLYVATPLVCIAALWCFTVPLVALLRSFCCCSDS